MNQKRTRRERVVDDAVKVPGELDDIFKAVGVCIAGDGSFHEYCDDSVT